MAIPIWKLAPALVYGNTVVLKLAYEAPLTGLHIAEAFAEADLPAGVLNVLTGRGSTVGAALVTDPRVRAVSFTGSVATGHGVRDEATRRGKRVQLELGGHNPLIVTADADLDRAVEASYAGAFWSAGQKCTATRRIYVQDEVYDTFKERLLVRIERGKVGSARPRRRGRPDRQREVRRDPPRSSAAGMRAGRCSPAASADDEGYVVAPTVFGGVRDDAFLQAKKFRPGDVAIALRRSTRRMRRANATESGLSAAIFTSSLGAATRFQNEAQAGVLHELADGRR
jgi:aldehyde dehydrogenase (NAD+)